MLHSALPRAYLAGPAIGYLGSYFNPEETYTYMQQHLDDNYAASRLHWEYEQQPRLPPPTPSPLDLSLKPPPTSCEAIEVDDQRSQHSSEMIRDYPEEEEEDVVVDDDDNSQRSCSSSVNSYLQFSTPQKHTLITGFSQHDVDSLRIAQNQKLLYQQLLQTPPQQQHPQPHQQHQQQAAPMTPPSTPSPPAKRKLPSREDDSCTPSKQEKPRAKKKHARRLKFDEDTSSPVSGTVILGPDEAVVTGDIDPAFNIVEVTEEARAELAKIENRLGPYQCKLCRQLHDDAFQLAQHRCSRIAHVEYRCPECDKRFSCPANLASHRRWHKPRPTASSSSSASSTDAEAACTRCDAKFSRPAALRKHMLAQHNENNNNNTVNNNNQDSCKPEIEAA